LLPTTLTPLLGAAVTDWGGDAAAALSPEVFDPLVWVSLGGWLLLGLVAGVGFWLYRRSRQAPRDASTWGCGYRFPEPRMQYTAGSFADSLVRLFQFGLWNERRGGRVSGLFPTAAKFSSHTPDAVLDRLLSPLFRLAAGLFRRIRAIVQNGVIAIYLIYVALAVMALLALGAL
jgi:hydrogenase-4 component B